MTLRLRTLPRYPARITGGPGISSERADGAPDVTVSFDFGSLTRIPSVDDENSSFFVTWNETLDLYSIMSFADTFAAVVDVTGLMASATYDPQGIEADAFARANHTGTQAISTVSGLQTALDGLQSGIDTKAPLASPALTGTPTAPTAPAGTSTTQIATTAFVQDARWRVRGIGEIYMVDTSLTGVEIPPATTTGTVWIELTSGLTGVGGFNNGKLTSESSSGSAPLVLASAVISFAGSPMNGQTVRLINTESRMLRPSLSPGTLQNDALQDITGSFDLRRMDDGTSLYAATSGAFSGAAAGGASAPRSSAGPGTLLTSDRISFAASNSSGARTANETRVKNLGVKAYMRIA